MTTGWFLDPRGADFARALEENFHENATLNWPGEAPVAGSARASRVWSSHGEDGSFFASVIHGETANRVRMEGFIRLRPGEHETAPREARAVMIWTRENGFDFRLRSLASEPPPPSDDH